MIEKITLTFSILIVFSFLLCRYAPSDEGWWDAILGGFLFFSTLGTIISAIVWIWL